MQDDEDNALIKVESAIRERNQRLADIRGKMKNLNEMLFSYLAADEGYVEADKAAKDAAAKKAGIKHDLLAKSEAQGLPDKIQAVRDQKNELEESLSHYLAEFQRLSGTNEFEDENGELKQIVYVARLVKRRADV